MELRTAQAGKVDFLAILKSFRPEQWIKNLLLLAVPFFAKTWNWKLIPAVLLFCLLSGLIYLANDLFDLEEDRNHPKKKLRPLASGRITSSQTDTILGLLILPVFAGAFLISKIFFLVCFFYAGLSFIYSLWLKKILIVDVLTVATGFVLRTYSGAIIVQAQVTHWFLLSIFAGALFLASAKRYNDSQIWQSRRMRETILTFSLTFFILCYTFYAASHEITAKFGSNRLLFTVPIVIYIFMRFLLRIYQGKDNPTDIFWSDRGLQIASVFYILNATWAIYGQNAK